MPRRYPRRSRRRRPSSPARRSRRCAPGSTRRAVSSDSRATPREVARAALASARTTGYRPVTAEALLVVGRIQVHLVDAAGVDALRDSMHAATASGDAAGMVEAAAWTIFALATQGSRHELA